MSYEINYRVDYENDSRFRYLGNEEISNIDDDIMVCVLNLSSEWDDHPGVQAAARERLNAIADYLEQRGESLYDEIFVEVQYKSIGEILYSLQYLNWRMDETGFKREQFPVIIQKFLDYQYEKILEQVTKLRNGGY